MPASIFFKSYSPALRGVRAVIFHSSRLAEIFLRVSRNACSDKSMRSDKISFSKYDTTENTFKSSKWIRLLISRGR